uniref:Adhesion G-protein coupled receptor G1 n=1 Tax=Catharus ustulatus TaxID=91951 RepID=A0A8C3UUL6_CATUS
MPRVTAAAGLRCLLGLAVPPADLLVSVCLYNAGVGATGRREEDFRFCGDRNQTQESSVIYENNPDNMTIANTAQALIIKRPNRNNSSYKYSLPPTLGRYRFCIYWFEFNRTLLLVYGKQRILLGRDPSSSIPRGQRSQETERTAAYIFNVSYIEKGGKNTSMDAKTNYSFPGKCNLMFWVVLSPACPLVIIRALVVSQYLWGGHSARDRPEGPAQSGSSAPDLCFPERGGSWTVCPSALGLSCSLSTFFLMSLSLQESGEVQGFTVDLPSSLFMMGKEREEVVEHRVLLMDISRQTMFQDENSSQVLGDKVVSISLVDTVVANLSDPVVLTFFHDQLPRNVTPLCVFWQEDTSSGSWDSYGCTTVTGSSQTECRCNHLTYFAVLMVSSPEITSVHRNYLSIITYVGCLISALASICTIFFLYFRSKQRDQIMSMRIHMNLLVAIFLLDITFLISEHLAASSEAICRFGGLFLHFSLLSCLTWMGIEGYNLYRLVIEVFNAYHDHFLLKLCLAGWGVPFLCVMLILLAGWNNYGPLSIPIYESLDGRSTNATICWITSPLIHNVVNLGFFSLVFLFNSIMLGAMVREILRQNKKGHKLKHVLALFGLSILLGIPWALIFFSFTSGVFCLVSLYIFTIINSLQGFLIFLWYWTMVLQARKSPDSQSSSDSAKLQPSSS